MMTIERVAAEIRRAYNTHATQAGPNAWMSLRSVAYRTDLTPEQITTGVLHMVQHEQGFVLAPESNQKTLTELDIRLAVRYGGQDNHIICWD